MGSISVLIASSIVGLVVMLGAIVDQAEARAFFVFGDSLVDNGNNNFLVTTARADAPPYGIDYPTHRPTGRFSNGLNIPDLIGERIGVESPLPYLNPELTGQRLLNGANFASAGIGVLNDTGIQFLNIIRIFEQMTFFEQYQQRVSAIIGEARTKQLVNQALVLITLGGNDFVNNYFLVPYSARSQQLSIPDYVRFVIFEYKKVLKKLHQLGVRRVLVTGAGPLGCAPAELARHSRNGECAVELQRASALFNPQLVQMINEVNSEIGSTVFTVMNAEKITMNFISNPQAYGFSTSKMACCGQGPYNGIGLCTSASNLCSDRDSYVFWDAFHPSEKANKLIVESMFSGTTEYMNPMNISTMLAMDSTT